MFHFIVLKRCMPTLVFALLICGSMSAYGEPSQQQLNATFQTFIDEIKKGCSLEHPNSDQKFRSCAETKYSSMKSFFEKLFYYRDNKGISSKELQIGTDCMSQFSPSVSDPKRKYAVERADWIGANNCYKSAIQ